MISVGEARKLVMSTVKRTAVEELVLIEAVGRYLAQGITSPMELPGFDNSAMDGYALRFEDAEKASAENPLTLRLVGVIPAGESPSLELQPGQTMQIFTGAMVPPGADAVIRQEDVIVDGENIIIKRPVRMSENIRFAGEEVKAGDVVLEAGQQINAAAIGVLASLGIELVSVYSVPRVGVLVTGSELMDSKSKLNKGQIFDSNSHTLSAALQEMNVPVSFVGHGVDDREELGSKLAEVLDKCDILLVTGGVSVGKFDYVKELAAECGIEEIFWSVKQKPGKPLYFGASADGGKIMFGLPGNPASALVGFYEYVRPAILESMGSESPSMITANGIMKNSYSKNVGLTHFLKGFLGNDGMVEVLERQGSHMMSSFAQANCLVIAEEEMTTLYEGDRVSVHLLPL